MSIFQLFSTSTRTRRFPQILVGIIPTDTSGNPTSTRGNVSPGLILTFFINLGIEISAVLSVFEMESIIEQFNAIFAAGSSSKGDILTCQYLVLRSSSSLFLEYASFERISFLPLMANNSKDEKK